MAPSSPAADARHGASGPTVRDGNASYHHRDDNDMDDDADSNVEATEPTENGYRYDSFPSYNKNNNNRRYRDTEAAAVNNGSLHHDHRTNGASTGSSSSSSPPLKPPAASTSARALAPDLLRGLLMIIMALDHTALALHTWSHGTGRVPESDDTVVRRFNRPVAYVVRTLTHLCAPGFTFLLGMGVVYLGRSRRGRLGWGAARLARYLAVRAAVLTAVTVVFGLVVTAGKVWFLNMVLFALAVDYLLAGLLWMAMDWTEGALARWLEGWMVKKSKVRAGDGAGERRPLLSSETTTTTTVAAPAVADATTGRAQDSTTTAALAASISWHVHNAAVLILSTITIWWNIWLSETHGHCQAESSSLTTTTLQSSPPPSLSASSSSSSSFTPSSAFRTATAPQNPLLRIWFWPVMDAATTGGGRVLSGFPPMAWLSFAILGLLYGRVLVAQSSRPRSPRAVAAAHVLVALLFALVFVLTRVLRVGNLSEGCLQTPAQQQQQRQDANPYLADMPSFFYIVKYPPDVSFWAFAMAGNLFLLALFAALPPRRLAPPHPHPQPHSHHDHHLRRWSHRLLALPAAMLLDFGTTALFFYVAHMLLVFALGAALVALFGHDTGVATDPMNPGDTRGIDNIAAYFAVWAAAMLMLWPVCRAYSRFKSTKSADSIWRFF
ncbi:hypothetical protein JDV02_010739 [Purpureocillium takamizusanense]|uniref:Heparan-alpha-glucosaminide N-acetyltransferase catalytic domain-containing protein n=1 Tax=Purpureocillium takamizusanense TaxID=2060973 RepID=A0A9Q8QSE5_9HYPO|nr:uncharacterized protein JDV02_010739 [Purpureocillium takamizusanense]UNI25030.1 hypothetical protein JDV02_010739 [Purpureocillium takamizusanense]